MKLNTYKQINNILENLSFLMDSGMAISDCLCVLQNKSKYKNNVILEIQENLNRGLTFSESLNLVFLNKIPHLTMAFIKIGESCGNLNEMIKSALDTDKQIFKLKSSFKGALAYPAFILSVALSMIVLIMMFIMPKLLPIFRDLHVNLPTTTKLFIFISNVLNNFGLYLLAIICSSLVCIIYLIKKSNKFTDLAESFLLKIWGFKNIYIYYYTSIIAVCTSKYLKSGYSFHESINLVGRFLGSKKYKESCVKISADVQSGKSISDAISSSGNLFPNWSHSIDIASQSGRLEVQFYRFYLENLRVIDEYSIQIKRWSEPLMMLLVGGIIGLFAVSIISPIYGAVQNANF